MHLDSKLYGGGVEVAICYARRVLLSWTAWGLGGAKLDGRTDHAAWPVLMLGRHPPAAALGPRHKPSACMHSVVQSLGRISTALAIEFVRQ